MKSKFIFFEVNGSLRLNSSCLYFNANKVNIKNESFIVLENVSIKDKDIKITAKKAIYKNETFKFIKPKTILIFK